METAEDILEVAPDAMLVMAKSGLIVYTNTKTEQVFGFDRGELLGKTVEALMPERFRTRHQHHRLAYFHDLRPRPMGVNMSLVGCRKDGSEFPVEISLSPANLRGETMVIAAIRDTTEREIARRATEENRMKDEFLLTLSHELRTPLTAILGWSTILSTHMLEVEEANKAIQSVIRSARLQARLIDDLLDVSRIVAGSLRLQVELVNLTQIVEYAIDIVRPAIAAKSLDLRLALDSDVCINGDQTRLQQVVWNLLSNAVKYTPKGGRVTVALRRVSSTAQIAVSDSGIGIKPEFLPHVFDRFRQADSSTTRITGGLGLGLSVVRHLVGLHGGVVEAASDGEGRGATFTVRLPLSAVAQGEAPTIMSSARQPVLPRLDGLRLLVIDDDDETRAVLKTLLSLSGALVRSAASADEGFELFTQNPPEVLICDIGMPVEDGYSFIRRIRALPPESGGKVPAIALTAYARTEDRTHVLLAGYQSHIAKPAEPAELVALVATLTGRTGSSV